MSYIVIRDTREKENNGWRWNKSSYCDGTIDDILETGDYTLKGYENILTIERKGSLSEWTKNINEERFKRELQRLANIKFAFILLEFTMCDIIDYPIRTNIPKYRWSSLRCRGPYILKKTIEFQMEYPVNIILCGTVGKEVASSIFKRTVEQSYV